MANTKSAEKAARQAEKHRARNVALRSRMRTAVRKVTTFERRSVSRSFQSTIQARRAYSTRSRLSARIRAIQ